MNDTNDEGIDGKDITLKVTGIPSLDIKSDKTEGGGIFTFKFTIPSNVPIEGKQVEFQAQFKGDDEYSGTSKDGTAQLIGGIPTDIVDLEVKPGDPITVQGTLVDTDGKGIDGRTMKLAGTVIENLPDKRKTDVTEGEGKFTFTFTIPGNVPIEGSSVNFQVLFEDDAPYLGTSKEVTYPPKESALSAMIAADTSEVATKLVLHEISNDNPDQPIKVEGTLTNDSGEGLAGKIITFSSSGTLRLKGGTVTTTSDGTFTVEGETPPGQEALLEVKAQFKSNDDVYQASESNVVRYPRGSNYPVLELDPIAGVDPTAHVPVKGMLSSSDSHEGLRQKPIRLTLTRTQGTSETISVSCGIDTPENTPKVLSSNPAGVPTEPYTTKTGKDGKFVFDGMGPLCKEGLWEVQAHFDGDSDYGPTSDAEGFSTSDDLIVFKVEDVNYTQRADKKEVGIELPIPDPSNLPKGCKLLTDEDHDDTLNEVDIRGTTLNFDSKDKTRIKIIEYSMFYDCQGGNSAADQMNKAVEKAKEKILKPDQGPTKEPGIILKTCPDDQHLALVSDPDSHNPPVEKCVPCPEHQHQVDERGPDYRLVRQKCVWDADVIR